MTSVLINCAGDSDLSKRIYDFLLSIYPYPASTEMILLNEDEITVQNVELHIKNSELRKALDKFQASNPDLVGYSIMEFGDIFTVGVLQSLDKLIWVCDMCGYLTQYEEEMITHKKIIHNLIGLSAF